MRLVVVSNAIGPYCVLFWGGFVFDHFIAEFAPVRQEIAVGEVESTWQDSFFQRYNIS